MSSFDRPPLNLLRQELAGTCIYLDILQKSTSGINVDEEELDNGSQDVDNTEQKLEGLAEAKLVSFCEQVLREASDLQSNVGETTNMDVHRVLELRSPIIVKVQIYYSLLDYLNWSKKHSMLRHFRFVIMGYGFFLEHYEFLDCLLV